MCSEADKFVTRGQNRIGSRYKKVRYVEYTDNTFTTKMLRAPEEQHLGILGKSDWVECVAISESERVAELVFRSFT